MTSDDTDPPPTAADGSGGSKATRRQRRNAAEVESAVLLAAVEELSENGYDGFTMDRVAARAGTSKTAIYRRWPSRTALAFAAYKQMVARPQDPPDTGDLRSDVLELLHAAADRMDSPVQSQIIRGLVIDARREPEVMADLRDEFGQGAPGTMLTILARAVARGEARRDSLIPRIATLPIALLRNEYLMFGPGPVSDQVITEIVDQVFLPLVRPR
ncbi:TetR/AcrR family transcriptional regulator [Actinomadura montaniterrae]|uniref:TetR/AcrR family transcriptional regulator n=1 Tax=Actinomadura montaniterrae TaxID=1803903 RepID=A0A6L3W7A4_9ACTN|nr:TetR/AcrR family transcriptional regulator [Actinomadura montaniterrae]KAB2388878.1 TetR/AcrR family transcriptional regulator [Actinomadura montaniterrae]